VPFNYIQFASIKLQLEVATCICASTLWYSSPSQATKMKMAYLKLPKIPKFTQACFNLTIFVNLIYIHHLGPLLHHNIPLVYLLEYVVMPRAILLHGSPPAASSTNADDTHSLPSLSIDLSNDLWYNLRLMCNGYIDAITLTSFLVSVRLVDPLFLLSPIPPRSLVHSAASPQFGTLCATTSSFPYISKR